MDGPLPCSAMKFALWAWLLFVPSLAQLEACKGTAVPEGKMCSSLSLEECDKQYVPWRWVGVRKIKVATVAELATVSSSFLFRSFQQLRIPSDVFVAQIIGNLDHVGI